jgi:MOSC domain-containing protein YiiM
MAPKSDRRRPPSGAGTVVEINISPQHEVLPAPVQRARAVSGRGLEGDRNFFAGQGTQPERDRELTLIAMEALDALAAEHGIELTAAESRRNIATRGIDLNRLEGRRFRVGAVECEGVELCEPCNDLQRLTKPGVLRGLVHRGGLRAAILTDGEIAVGDPVAPLASDA